MLLIEKEVDVIGHVVNCQGVMGRRHSQEY